jgi:DNA-binding NarL/FixJ family response regulator
MTCNGSESSQSPAGKITIVLADPQSVVRRGLRAFLEREPDLAVAGEASNGLEALLCVEQLRPHMLIVDLEMPQLDGLEVAREVTRLRQGTRVLLLSERSGERHILDAFRSGASGYVLKNSPVQELVAAILRVHSGLRYLPPPYSEAAIDAFLKAVAKDNDSPRLTRRQRQILRLIAEGASNAEIGARLSISPRTVESHRSNLMRKLVLRNRTDLLRYALDHPPAGEIHSTSAEEN